MVSQDWEGIFSRGAPMIDESSRRNQRRSRSRGKSAVGIDGEREPQVGGTPSIPPCTLRVNASRTRVPRLSRLLSSPISQRCNAAPLGHIMPAPDPARTSPERLAVAWLGGSGWRESCIADRPRNCDFWANTPRTWRYISPLASVARDHRRRLCRLSCAYAQGRQELCPPAR
jgi:hypothetical protein